MARATYDFEIAKSVLTESDKSRILCIYLNCDPAAIDWAKATEAFGAASVESMKVCARNALKKIADAGGKIEADGTVAATASTAKKGGKRKGGNGDGDGKASPNKRGKMIKKDVTPRNHGTNETNGLEEDVTINDNEELV